MLTLDNAISEAIKAEHDDNIRKLAAVVRNANKIVDLKESEIDNIEDFIEEARTTTFTRTVMTEDVTRALLDKACKLKVIPFDPKNGQIIY